MRKYLARDGKIKPIEVLKEAEKSVVYRCDFFKTGTRISRESLNHSVNDTWEDARNWLIRRAELRVHSLLRQLDGANSTLGNLKGMRAPPDEST